MSEKQIEQIKIRLLELVGLLRSQIFFYRIKISTKKQNNRSVCITGQIQSIWSGFKWGVFFNIYSILVKCYYILYNIRLRKISLALALAFLFWGLMNHMLSGYIIHYCIYYCMNTRLTICSIPAFMSALLHLIYQSWHYGWLLKLLYDCYI